MYLFITILFCMSTDVPVHHYACSVYFFFFGITCTLTFQLISGYLPTDPPEDKFTCLPSCFSFAQEQRPTCHHNYLCTCPYMYPFMVLPVHFHTFILINRLDLPINVSTGLHVHRCTCSSLYCPACPHMYLYIFILYFRLNAKIYPSTFLLRCMTLFICLSSCFSFV